MLKRPKPARGEAWGILNPYGDLWTYETFESPEAAAKYVERFWMNIQMPPEHDLAKFKAVRVRVTVSVLRDGASSASTSEAGQVPGTNQNGGSK